MDRDQPATKSDLEDMKIELIRGVTTWTVGSMALIVIVVVLLLR